MNRMFQNCRALIFLAFSVLFLPALASAQDGALPVGVAEIDITPSYPIRLNGFGFRRKESEGIIQKIWAKALVFEDKEQGPALLIAVDNLGITDEIHAEIARRLAKTGLKRERLAITATHTHSAPMLTGISPTIFGVPITAEEQARVTTYTAEFIDKLERVALAALKDVRPGKVSWGIGTAGFAFNRRTKDGPVDHDLPVLLIRGPDDSVRGIYFSYACHCVTVSLNQISGDWAGFAQAALEKQFPGAVALASVGCGADSNPRGQGTNQVTNCELQAAQVTREIQRIIAGGLKPIRVLPKIEYDRIDVPFDTPRTRAEWEERAKSTDYAVAYHAKITLERLDRGEKLPGSMNYPIQSWIFGDDLAMIFLPGETVVDYALRLKRELDRDRVWINGYSNEERCYLPSERILREGGYEGGHAMIYYDRPQRFAPGLENRIAAVVRKQIPPGFVAAKGTEGTKPLSAADSLLKIRTRPGLEVQLVAAEPLIQDPVAIDWGADGRLWVCEMNDYPTGLDQNWQPGGQVKFLRDTNGDGQYDAATLFLDGLPFPTGVTAWGKGVLICAAPDILYAEDTNGDGKADKVVKVFSGFATENYQARVNSLSLGLDNWIYGANGLLGGMIRGTGQGIWPAMSSSRSQVDIRGHDFRFRPENGVFEPVSGLSQQGRVRDDFGHWFGCDNSQLLLHFPLTERYFQRNPNAPSGPAVINLTARAEGNRVFPISRLLERYNDPSQANRATSVCGLGLYRDTLLGDAYYGNAFSCEPVHNLVHREVLKERDGFSSARAKGEDESEFLASEDNWFRPVQARTGPDGALYVVDMYRFLIEHPRWIPAARLAQIDVRAGADRGRIYRVKAKDAALRPIRDLTMLSGRELAGALDSPNGVERDRVQTELLARKDSSAKPELERLAGKATLPQVRLQALSALDGLGGLSESIVERGLSDSDAHVRKQSIGLAESFIKRGEAGEAFRNRLLALARDPSREALEQLAFTLGEWESEAAGKALAMIGLSHPGDARLRAAVLSSARPHLAELFSTFSKYSDWLAPLAATAGSFSDQKVIAQALDALLPKNENADMGAAYGPVAALLEASGEKGKFSGELGRRLEILSKAASRDTLDRGAPEPRRVAALSVLAHTDGDAGDVIAKVAASSPAGAVRKAAFGALRQQHGAHVADPLLAKWSSASAVARSEILALLREREDWTIALLAAMKSGAVEAATLPLEEKERLLSHPHAKIQQLARELFPKEQAETTREAVVRNYASVPSLRGDSSKGGQIFAQNCSSCHFAGGQGHDLGPSLAAIRDKEPDYWVKNILDPNAVVEPRFVNYNVELKNDRSLSGVIKAETPAAILLASAGGVSENIPRSQIRELRASKLSLMPEGFEQAINPQQMADLIAYLKAAAPAAAKAGDASDTAVLRDAATVAKFILDPKQPNALRENAVKANPQFAADLITEMTRDLTPGTPEEYVRIPWIWRVAISCGKRNETVQIRRVLAAALPEKEAPLRDWQAVVIGGGIVNGVSQRGAWPRVRLAEVLGDDGLLQERWQHALDLASKMADDEKVKPGTRYDALRMLGVEPWDKRGQQLKRFLGDRNGELQMGAVSALSDVQGPEAARALIEAFAGLTKENRKLALEALTRDDSRRQELLGAISRGQIKPADLTEEIRSQLNSARK